MATTLFSEAKPAEPAETRVAHVAIIMDGNGRWAAARGLPRSAGHKEGAAAARRAVEAARDLGLTHLTLYSFSTENWRRPVSEIRDLMGLLRQFIGDELPTLKKEGVKVTIIGDKKNLDTEIKLLVGRAEKETAANSKFFLQIAFNYGGRDEIVRAARRLAQGVAAGTLNPEAIDEELFARTLDTAPFPDPDFVIRTSGEKRISNFLLWQAAYAEYVFLDIHWPDFNAAYFEGALAEFHARERRFGGLTTAS
ncbi:MAG: isoprenyl transferase [Parvularculaceae bacterium]|nr:isoprenyl transferase [Parvularculaceae bacterium]